MFNQQSANTASFAAAANHCAYASPQPRSQPSKLLYLDVTRRNFGNASLSESYLLDLSRQAILSGCNEQKCIDGVIYNHIIWNNLSFWLNSSFDTVLMISWANAPTVATAKPQQASSQYNILHYDEDSEEYEMIIDEIVDCVDRDMQADYACAFYSVGNEGKTPMPSVEGTAEQTQLIVHARDACSTNTTPTPPPKNVDYHAIYLKPIMERIAKCEPEAQVTESYVMDIVSSALTMGVKRQISKRTFSFTWGKYTAVMSKSLKTILDVAVVRDGEVVTVHPDVVSILAKKCPSLDYFEIQRIAKRAKQSGEFEEKKKDYRKQFIYDFEGYRIVFASNHSTIVEMQCNE